MCLFEPVCKILTWCLWIAYPILVFLILYNHSNLEKQQFKAIKVQNSCNIHADDE